MKNWIRKTIGELCIIGGGKVQTGPFGSQLHQSDYSDEGIPVIMPSDILDGDISVDKIARVSENHVDRLVKHKISKGDIIYGRRGDIGRQALIRESQIGWLCGTGCLKVSLGNSEVIPEFLHLYLKMPEIISWIQNQAIGATMPNLNTSILKRVPIFYPASIEDQKKIVSLIFTYDNLIENNKHRIILLENMAEEIYHEWFVRFRFPGYQTAIFEKGIPKEWKETEIFNVVDFKSGFAFKSDKYVTGGRYGIVTIKNVHNGKFIPECSDHIEQPPNTLPKHCFINSGDILMSLTGNVGRVCIAHGKTILLNQRVVSLKPKQDHQSHFIYWLFRQKSMITFCEMISTGAAQQNLSPIKLGAQNIIYPNSLVVKDYQKIVNPLMVNIMNLLEENKNLNSTKNMLLPRLISGKLSVEDLDIRFPPSMHENNVD